MIQPPLHERFPSLRDYRLLDLALNHDDPLIRKLLATWKHNVALTYAGEQVDWQIVTDCYLLVAETAEVLYGPGPWDDLDYQVRSRPMLEAVLTEQIKLSPSASDRDKAVAIMRYSRDICVSKPGDEDIFHGGTEEDVIRKRSGMCNEQARVMIRLAQIAGLPARYVGHITGDHGCAEIKIDGAWAYFDIRGHTYETPDGRIASIWDLKQDPALIERAKPPDMLPGRTRAMTRTQTHPRAITVIAPYRCGDYTWRNYGWTHNTPELRRQLAEHEPAWHAVLDELHEGADFTRAG